MSAKFIRLLLSAVIAFAPAATSQASTFGDYKYIYRHKPTVDGKRDNPGVENPENKNITAFYVAGVDSISARGLPMKPEWQDDAWNVVGGTLPAGLSFDPATLTFSGTPTAAGPSFKVDLEGIDSQGRQVARAAVTFDVREIGGRPVKVSFYGHTGKSIAHRLEVPAGTVVDRWTEVYATPAGTEVIGHIFSLVMDFGTGGTNLSGFRINDSSSQYNSRLFGRLIAAVSPNVSAPYASTDSIWIEKSHDMETWTAVSSEYKILSSNCSGGSCSQINHVRIGF